VPPLRRLCTSKLPVLGGIPQRIHHSHCLVSLLFLRRDSKSEGWNPPGSGLGALVLVGLGWQDLCGSRAKRENRFAIQKLGNGPAAKKVFAEWFRRDAEIAAAQALGRGWRRMGDKCAFFCCGADFNKSAAWYKCLPNSLMRFKKSVLAGAGSGQGGKGGVITVCEGYARWLAANGQADEAGLLRIAREGWA
jgi:hypothetical protein